MHMYLQVHILPYTCTHVQMHMHLLTDTHILSVRSHRKGKLVIYRMIWLLAQQEINSNNREGKQIQFRNLDKLASKRSIKTN